MPSSPAGADAPHALLTLNEVAARWRVHRKTVIRLLSRGEIEGLRIGGQIRVRAESVEAYEAANATAAPATSPRRLEAWQ